jgi:hypothetical protein
LLSAGYQAHDTLGGLGWFQHRETTRSKPMSLAVSIVPISRGDTATRGRLRVLGGSIGRSRSGQTAMVAGRPQTLELPAPAGVPRTCVHRFAVECERDSERGEIPVRFGWPGRMRQITELIDRWEGDEDIYFRVRTEDASTYILRRNRVSGAWQIHFFRRGAQS